MEGCKSPFLPPSRLMSKSYFGQKRRKRNVLGYRQVQWHQHSLNMHVCARVCSCVFVHMSVCLCVEEGLGREMWGHCGGVGNGFLETVSHVGWHCICFSVCESGVGELPPTLALKLQPKQPFSCSFSFLAYKRGNNNSAFPCRTCMDSQIIARESGNSKGNKAPSTKGNDLQVKLRWVQHKREPGTGV